MATLRPMRSPSPSTIPTSSSVPQQLQPTGVPRPPQSRQSLGPPTTAPSSANRTAFGSSAAGYRHVSLAAGGGGVGGAAGQGGGSPQLGGTRELGGGASGNASGTGARPGMGGPRPSSEYINRSTPEPESIDGWFNDLTAYETTLEAMATASLDQNFTDELSAIEQWFKVLNDHERAAAFYSLLQYATPSQIRFFQTVLSKMAKSDPVTALLSPAVGSSMQAQMESRLPGGGLNGLRSPLMGGGFSGSVPSPNPNQFLAPESAFDSNTLSPVPGSNTAALSAQRPKRQNRISAPGTLQLAGQGERFAGGGLDNVMERGPSPGVESNASHSSPYLSAGMADPTARPKSTDFSGIANVPSDSKSPFARSPRPSAGNSGNSAGGAFGLGLGHPSPGVNLTAGRFEDQLNQLSQYSPMIGNWASMTNTPMMPMFQEQAASATQSQVEAALATLKVSNWNAQNQTAANGRVVLDDASKFRRTSNRQQSDKSGPVYNDDGDMVATNATQPGRTASPMNSQPWTRSPLAGGSEFGGASAFGLGGGLASLGMGGYENSTAGLSGLGMGLSGNLAGVGNLSSLLAMNQAANPASAYAANSGMGQFGNGGGAGGFGGPRTTERVSSRTGAGKRSPMIRQSPSPGAGNVASVTGGGGGAGSGAGVAGPDDVDERVLKDVPGWLRVLRLHKYTPNFEKYRWQEIVIMNDSDLSDKGVAALGARRKLLKAFANIRNHYGIPHPEGYLPDVDPVNPADEPKEGSQSGQA